MGLVLPKPDRWGLQRHLGLARVARRQTYVIF